MSKKKKFSNNIIAKNQSKQIQNKFNESPFLKKH